MLVFIEFSFESLYKTTMQKGERMKEYELRQSIMMSDLKPMEKLVMLAILMRVDWSTFSGQVSVNQLIDLTNSTRPTIKRTVANLVKKGWITRTSRHIERTKSTAAFTTIQLDKVSIKTDTVSNMNRIKNDTPTVSNMNPHSIKSDTLDGIKTDTHTISNNINTVTNNMEEPEPHGNLEVDQNSIEGGDEFWLYPSSIEDPVVRRRTELYIQSHPNLPHSERQRLLFPQLCVPIWSNNLEVTNG